MKHIGLPAFLRLETRDLRLMVALATVRRVASNPRKQAAELRGDLAVGAVLARAVYPAW